MNQEKIGKFIAYLRKEKNMTQLELAEKLGIPDRAISKWENGRGMPDLSHIQLLCEILDISINELLNGERINENQYQEKSEEIIVDTINYTENKLKKSKTKFVTIFVVIVLIVLSFVVLFNIDITRMRNNEPVFFSTWGFDYAPPINLEEDKIMLAIENYLVTRNECNSKRYNNEKWFVSLRTYLIEEYNEYTVYNIYAWALEESYYYENGQIEQGSGMSTPYKFVVEKVNNEFVVTDVNFPRDGTYYPEDMKTIFPEYVRKKMEKVHDDGTIKKLQNDIQKQAKLYFHE